MTKKELEKIFIDFFERQKEKQKRRPSIIIYTSVANAEKMEKTINELVAEHFRLVGLNKPNKKSP